MYQTLLVLLVLCMKPLLSLLIYSLKCFVYIYSQVLSLYSWSLFWSFNKYLLNIYCVPGYGLKDFTLASHLILRTTLYIMVSCLHFTKLLRSIARKENYR